MEIGARWRWLLVFLLLLAFGLRIHKLEAQSFWNDEGNSARLSERSIQLIIEGTASDIHPPLYYLILNQWRKLVGDSEFGLRSLSLFAGVLIVPLTFVLGKKLGHGVAQRSRRGARRRGGWLLGIVVAALIAINPGMIYYSQEARMYALLGLWGVLSTVLLLRWLKVEHGVARRTSELRGELGGRFGRGRPFLIGMAYVLVVVAGLYTHYFFPAVLLLHNLFVFTQIIQTAPKPFTIKKLPLTIKQWPLLMVTAFLLYAPWLPIFLNQFGSDPISRPSILEFMTAVSHWLTFGATVDLGAGYLWLVAGLLIVGVVYGRIKVVLPVLGIFVPLAMMYFTGTTGSEFFKFLVVAVPFWLIWLAAGLLFVDTAVRQTNIRSWVIAVGLLILGWGMVQSLQNMYTDPTYARADYRSMAQRIVDEAHPNAGIILNAPNQWEVFTYYFPDDGTVYPLPDGHSRPHPDEIDVALRDIAAQHERIYAIFWGEVQRDPERLIESWLDANAFKATDSWYGDVRFVSYAVPSAPVTEMETAVNIPFGDTIMLNGYTLGETMRQPGDIVEVTLFWETAVSLQTRYKVFLHLLDANGQLVAQRDSEPGGGLVLTTTWQPAQVIIDNHGLLIPHELPLGEYELRLGLYDLTDPDNRLLIESANGTMDSFTLPRITVTK